MSLFNDGLVASFNKLSNELLYLDKIPTLPGRAYSESITHDSSWVRQVYAKEASSNARSIRNKYNKAKKQHNTQKHQAEIISKYESGDIEINWNGNIQLDGRFVSIEDSKDSIYDYWIKFQWKGVKFHVPFNKTSHQRNLEERGFELKRDTLKLCRNGHIVLAYKLEPKYNQNSKSIGIDTGRNKSFMCSDGNTENITKCILNSLRFKRHGSKNSTRVVRKLKQTIDYLIKHNIDWNNLEHIVLENLTGLKTGKCFGKINHHWSYRHIQQRIKMRAEELNVSVSSVHPAYTSQRCSSCGHIDKRSREAEKFKCVSCDVELDADFNASLNILNRGLNNTHAKKF